MWTNAQRDGRPVLYRWRPLFNAANFGWRPLLEYHTVTLPEYGPTKLCDCAQMAIFCVLYFKRAACSTFQTCILNSHQGHIMRRSMVDIQSATAEIRRGIKKIER